MKYKHEFVGEGNFASAEATGTGEAERDLLKKVDQNLQTKKTFNVYLFFTWDLW